MCYLELYRSIVHPCWYSSTLQIYIYRYNSSRFFNYCFSELRTDDRRIHRPSPIEFSERNPYPDRQFESHRIPSHISDWNTIRRPLSQQSDNTRRVLEPSVDTNGYHPTGKNHWLVVYSMRVSCGFKIFADIAKEVTTIPPFTIATISETKHKPQQILNKI